MSYVPKVYREQGGAAFIVASGGELDIESGGALKIAGTAVTATAAELNQLDNADKLPKTVKVALAASDAAAGLFSWRNTEESANVIVTDLYVNVTTKTTGACTMDCGWAATEILSDTLIDGKDINAATGLFSNIDDAGTNGKGHRLVLDDEYITGSVASGASAGLVGFAYITYIVV
ncbi:MAG TPA: hypothetical protein VMW52_06180 [Phycisphaerae bacterium]|nr:hypothetical protein [Phycisphaerae bacterium]